MNLFVSVLNLSVVEQLTTYPKLVCSTPLLAPRIGLYTASLVSLTDVLIDWRASDCDAPTQLLRIQINTGNTAPSPTWRTSPTWRKQKAFSLPGTVALWVFWKSREFPAFLIGRGQSYARRHGTLNSLTQNHHNVLYQIGETLISACYISLHWEVINSPLTI